MLGHFELMIKLIWGGGGGTIGRIYTWGPINDVSVDIVEEFDQFHVKTAANNVYVGG